MYGDNEKNLEVFTVNDKFSQKIVRYIYYSTYWRMLYHMDDHS